MISSFYPLLVLCIFLLQLVVFSSAFRNNHLIIRKAALKPFITTIGTSNRILTSLNQHIQSSFDEFLDSMDAPVLVDFYAEWCGPCRMMTPVLQDIAGRFENIAKIAKIDTDKAPNIAAKYQVEALPTLILFYKGEIIDRYVGYRDASTLEKELVQVNPWMNICLFPVVFLIRLISLVFQLLVAEENRWIHELVEKSVRANFEPRFFRQSSYSLVELFKYVFSVNIFNFFRHK